MLFTEELREEANAKDEACGHFSEAGRCFKRFNPESAWDPLLTVFPFRVICIYAYLVLSC